MAKKPKFTIFDIKDLIDKLDPKRKERKVAYIFSNGRKFLEKSKLYQ